MSIVGKEVSISCVGPVSMAPVPSCVVGQLQLQVKHSGVTVGDKGCRVAGFPGFPNPKDASGNEDTAVSLVTLCSSAKVFTVERAVVQELQWRQEDIAAAANQSSAPCRHSTNSSTEGSGRPVYIALSLVADGSVHVANALFANNTNMLPLVILGRANVTVTGSSFTANQQPDNIGTTRYSRHPLELWVLSNGRNANIMLNGTAFTRSRGSSRADMSSHPAVSVESASPCTVQVINSSFVENLAGGLTIYLSRSQSTVVLQDSVFERNNGSGAAVYTGTRPIPSDVWLQRVVVAAVGSNRFVGCRGAGLVIESHNVESSPVVIAGPALFAGNSRGLSVEMPGAKSSSVILSDSRAHDWKWALDPDLADHLEAAVADRGGGPVFRKNKQRADQAYPPKDVAAGVYINLDGSDNCEVQAIGPITFDGNQAMYGGGMLVSMSNSTMGWLPMSGMNFSGNRGGGLLADLSEAQGASLNIISSLFQDNVGVGTNGGALAVDFGSGVIPRFGGGDGYTSSGRCKAFGAQLLLKDLEFKGNSAASGSGGAIHINSEAYCPETATNFRDMNIFTMLGGEITALLSHKDARMEQFVVQGWRVKFINNSAMYGGALYASGVSMMLRDAEFRHNQAAVLGGGVCLERTTEVELGAVSILHNRWGAVCWTLIQSAVCCHVKRRRCLGLITAHRLCPQHSTLSTAQHLLYSQQSTGGNHSRALVVPMVSQHLLYSSTLQHYFNAFMSQW